MLLKTFYEEWTNSLGIEVDKRFEMQYCQTAEFLGCAFNMF